MILLNVRLDFSRAAMGTRSLCKKRFKGNEEDVADYDPTASSSAGPSAAEPVLPIAEDDDEVTDHDSGRTQHYPSLSDNEDLYVSQDSIFWNKQTGGSIHTKNFERDQILFQYRAEKAPER